MTAYYHGTPADLRPGDCIEPGREPAWVQSEPGLVYFTDSPRDARAWGRETNLYRIAPTGDYGPDSHFPGGVIGARSLADGLVIMPARATRMSYQTDSPLIVLGRA